MSWVLRLDSDELPTFWRGPEHGQLGSIRVSEALVCDTPAELRDAMRAVGWRPCEPGWIVPLRVAQQQAVLPPLSLFAL